LCSALTQALLYYSTFGPFLVFAFLLNGIDLLAISVLLGASLVTCVGLSLIGIALATLSHVKFGRGLLMAIFGAALVIAWFASIAVSGEVASSPQDLRDPEGQIAAASYVSFVLVVGGLFAAVASARFAHLEENLSSGMRILATLVVLLAGAWAAWLHAQFGEEEIAWGMQVGAGCVLLLLWLHFLTERETLGRRVATQVSPRAALALLQLPFLPGGARGLVLFALHFVCALVLGVLALATGTKHGGEIEVVGIVTTFYGYLFVFLGLPTGIASLRVGTARTRMVTRIVTLCGIPFLILAPALVGLLFGLRSWMELEHPLNPVWVMDRIDSTRNKELIAVVFIGLGLCAGLTLLINRRRLIHAVREVLAASRARRERERAA
jgi:hypothetical protein